MCPSDQSDVHMARARALPLPSVGFTTHGHSTAHDYTHSCVPPHDPVHPSLDSCVATLPSRLPSHSLPRTPAPSLYPLSRSVSRRYSQWGDALPRVLRSRRHQAERLHVGWVHQLRVSCSLSTRSGGGVRHMHRRRRRERSFRDVRRRRLEAREPRQPELLRRRLRGGVRQHLQRSEGLLLYASIRRVPAA